MPKEVKRYKCIYCNKFTRAKKANVIHHEMHCYCNPDNKSCSTCCHGDGYICYTLKKPIYVKGEAIKNCPHWNIILEAENCYVDESWEFI